ncbi:hypothetical protein ABZV87_37445 [Streptomyces tendae]|uniref:hypothetical protein n=1 Tax=Streptomyces tendae TaxID=1932 RepID=UPI0033A33FAC
MVLPFEHKDDQVLAKFEAHVKMNAAPNDLLYFLEEVSRLVVGFMELTDEDVIDFGKVFAEMPLFTHGALTGGYLTAVRPIWTTGTC